MEPDWDLHAVVRGFTTIKKSTTAAIEAAATDGFAEISSSVRDVKQTTEERNWSQHDFCSPNLFQARETGVVEEMHELFVPYLLKPGLPRSVQPTISSYLVALEATKSQTHQQHQRKEPQSLGIISTNMLTSSTRSAAIASVPQQSQINSKPKKRKNHLKRVSHVPAESLSSDIWSWRKYGQKPIKGSPYPRGYYKCSSSKTCLARKQVERNRTDPTMFIVTYTADHNHPAPTHKNSLAGTTRHPNPLSSSSSTAPEESSIPVSKPSSSSSMATMSPSASQEDEVLQQSNEMESKSVDVGGDYSSRTNLMDDVIGFLDMEVTDEFFEDLHEIAGPAEEGFYPGQVLPNFPRMDNTDTNTSYR